MAGSVEIFEGEFTSDWYFRVKAPNGEIVAQSEAYSSRFAAMKGVEALGRVLERTIAVKIIFKGGTEQILPLYKGCP